MGTAAAGTSMHSRSLPHGKFDILILGAGIGGLSLAILLSQAGHRVSIAERKSSYDDLSEGGGISLSANAVLPLKSMGIGERLQQIGDNVPHTIMRRYDTGEAICTRPSIGHHVMVHRHDLLIALYERAIELGVDFKFEKRVSSLQLSSAPPLAHFHDGTQLFAEIIIGADGVNSTVRKCLFPDLNVESAPTSDCVFLVSVPVSEMKKHEITAPLCDIAPYDVWMGPGRSVVSWHMEGRSDYHLQFCEHEYGNGEAYGGHAENESYITKFEDMERFRQRWSDFHEQIRTILSLTGSCTKWRIATAAPLPAWTGYQGRLILLGDAAHAIAPFAGQGAAMAVEDATCLAALFGYARTIEDMATVAQVYEQVRRSRVETMQQLVLDNVAMFSLYDGDKQRARDAGLRLAANKQRDRDNVKTARQWGEELGPRRHAIGTYDIEGETHKAWRGHHKL